MKSTSERWNNFLSTDKNSEKMRRTSHIIFFREWFIEKKTENTTGDEKFGDFLMENIIFSSSYRVNDRLLGCYKVNNNNRLKSTTLYVHTTNLGIASFDVFAE